MACSRKTLIYLILTLNHIYPDYDFSQLRAQHFEKETSVSGVEEAVDSHLLEVSRVSWGMLISCICLVLLANIVRRSMICAGVGEHSRLCREILS